MKTAQREGGDYRVGVGASSVLMILVVLAMTALGLLSLGSARQTEAQTKRNLQTTLDYYAAAERAQRALAALDEAVAAYRAEGGAGAPDENWLAERGVDAYVYDEDGRTLYEMTLDAGEEHQLTVSGELCPIGGARYTVTGHVLSVTGTYDFDQPMNLIGVE